MLDMVLKILVESIFLCLEYIQTYLITKGLFDLRLRKKHFLSLIALGLIGVISALFFDEVTIDVIHILIPPIFLIVNVLDKKDIKRILFSAMIYNVLDTLVTIVINFFVPAMQGDAIIQTINDMLFELCMMIVVMLFYILVCKKRNSLKEIHMGRYLSFYSMIGFAIMINACIAVLYFTDYNMELNKIIAVLILSTAIILITLILLTINVFQIDKLQDDISLYNRMVYNQVEYYKVLEEKDRATKAFRHDIRKHLFCMKHLSDTNDYEQLNEYIGGLCENVTEISPLINTGNGLISSIITEEIRQYPNVKIKCVGHLPSDMGISNIDLCTIFYNLFQNSCEAGAKFVEGLTKENREKDLKKMDFDVYVEMSITNMNKIITIKNKRINPPKKNFRGFISSKKESEHGIGMVNVLFTIDKINGSIITSDDGYLYTTEVIIPNNN